MRIHQDSILSRLFPWGEHLIVSAMSSMSMAAMPNVFVTKLLCLNEELNVILLERRPCVFEASTV